MLSRHSIWATVATAALAVPASATAQVVIPQPLPDSVGTTFSIFLRGAPIGTEQIAVHRVASGWTIVSSGRLAAPLDAVARRLQVRYTADWKPLDFTLDALVRGQPQGIRTAVEGTTAKSDVVAAGQTTQKTDTIDSNARLLRPTNCFGPYE